ncbi:hypothetical protein EMCRGX_G020744 [Ephydatia muelleri]
MVECLFDSGAAVSVVRFSVLSDSEKGRIRHSNVQVMGANGSPLDVMGVLSLKVRLGSFKDEHEFTVVRELTVECLFGADFMEKNDVLIDCKRRCLQLGSSAIEVPFIDSPVRASSGGVADNFKVSSDVEGHAHAQRGGASEKFRKGSWLKVDLQGSELTTKEMKELRGLLEEYSELFSDGELGRTSKVKHGISTSGPPIRQPIRRQPVALRKTVQEEIHKMLKNKVIRPSTSPWSSPIIMVRKKDGSWRFCIDFRKLNSVTHKDAYPLPRIDETLESLAGSTIFSTLDLASGYWQVELEENDKEKTAFSTMEGHFEFNVMPFGLTNAPSRTQERLTTPPVLAFPQFDREFLLATDASDSAIGAVLSQVDDNGTEKIIAYWSRQLTKAERNYSTIEREALAIVKAVKEFYPYLYAHDFILQTDHQPLVHKNNLRDVGGRVTRWSVFLQQFRFSVRHKAGKLNGNADGLSRTPSIQLAAAISQVESSDNFAKIKEAQA